MSDSQGISEVGFAQLFAANVRPGFVTEKKLSEGAVRDTRPFNLSVPGRNDSCRCGSGRKFKMCCGNAAAKFQ